MRACPTACPPPDLPLLCGSSCYPATGKPSASLGHIQVNDSPECILAAKAGFEDHPKSRRLLAHTASACGNRWSPAPWGGCVSRAAPHLSPLLLPPMENHAHAHARVGGQPGLRLFPGAWSFSPAALCVQGAVISASVVPFLTWGQTPSLPAFMFSN